MDIADYRSWQGIARDNPSDYRTVRGNGYILPGRPRYYQEELPASRFPGPGREYLGPRGVVQSGGRDQDKLPSLEMVKKEVEAMMASFGLRAFYKNPMAVKNSNFTGQGRRYQQQPQGMFNNYQVPDKVPSYQNMQNVQYQTSEQAPYQRIQPPYLNTPFPYQNNPSSYQ